MRKNSYLFTIYICLLITIICIIIVYCSNVKDTVEEDPSLIQSILELDNQVKEDINKIKSYDINDVFDHYGDIKQTSQEIDITKNINESYVQKDEQYTVPSDAQSLEYVDESEGKMNIQYYEKSKDYRNDPEYAHLSYIDEYETPRGKVSYVMLSKQRGGSKVNQFDHYIRYFYNDKGELVKLNKDYVLPYMTKSDHIAKIDENGYIIATEDGHGDFFYMYYTKDGNNYKTEMANGNIIRSFRQTEEFNGKQYIKNLNGGALKKWILIPEGSDYEQVLQAYYKGENVIYVDPKDIENEFKLTRNNRQQAKLIDENIKNDSYTKEQYLKAKNYSTLINSNNENLQYLNDLVGLEGYVDDLQENHQGQYGFDYNKFSTNPVNKRGFTELVETDYVFIKDYAKVIHIMDKDKAEQYTEEIFEDIRNYINSSDSNKSEAKQRIIKYENVSVIQAGKQIKSTINNKTKKYIKELQNLFDKKWPLEEDK